MTASSSLLLFALLLLVPALWAALMRWTRCPGWSVIGGALAGFILGQTIFARVMPHNYERLIQGGIEDRETSEYLEALRESERIAAELAAWSPEEMQELLDRQEVQRLGAERVWRDAQFADQAPLQAFVLMVVALTLLGAGFVDVRQSSSPSKQQLISPLSVGVWSAALPGGLTFGAAHWLLDLDVPAAAAVGAAVAIGPWILTTIDRDAADQAELGGARMIQSAGRVATIIAILAFAFAMYSSSEGRLWTASLPLLAAPLSWLIWASGGRWIERALHHVLAPTLAACVAMRVDFYENFAFWPILIVLLLSGDGRWLGAFAGAMLLGGRHNLRTMRLVLGAMASGPTQLAVAAVAVHMRVIDGEWALALLLGAVLIEVTVNARRSMAQRLVATEHEIDRITSGDDE